MFDCLRKEAAEKQTLSTKRCPSERCLFLRKGEEAGLTNTG